MIRPTSSRLAGHLRRPLRRFAETEKRDLQKLQQASEDLAKLNETIEKSYDPLRFRLSNSRSFIQTLQETEEAKKRAKAGFNYRQFIKNFQLPLLMLLASLLTYYMWSTVPFTVIFRQLTLSEYTIQRNYLHTVFTSALSFKGLFHLLVYFPAMAFSLAVLARRLTTRHFALMFGANSVLSAAATIAYEKRYSGAQDELMPPKTLGPCTALMFIGGVGTVGLKTPLLGVKSAPLWILPMAYSVYEAYAYRELNETSVSRPSHLVSLANGLLLGAVLRRYGALYSL